MTLAPHEQPILNATIRVDNLPQSGRELRVATTEEQRQALAQLLKVTAVNAFDAELNATPFRGGIRVLGRLRGAIEQPCVVSFAPVVQHIDEPIDRVFLPASGKPPEAAAGAEVFVDLEGDDLPDELHGSEADLSDLLIETIALAIDPYPRAPGASLDALGPVDDGTLSPFASLKSLKKSGDES